MSIKSPHKTPPVKDWPRIQACRECKGIIAQSQDSKQPRYHLCCECAAKRYTAVLYVPRRGIRLSRKPPPPKPPGFNLVCGSEVEQ